MGVFTDGVLFPHAHPGDDERGVADVSETLYTKVTRYHAQIGANVPREMLSKLGKSLTYIPI